MAEDEDFTDGCGFGEELGAGVEPAQGTHAVELGQRVGMEVAEDAQGAVTAVEAVVFDGGAHVAPFAVYGFVLLILARMVISGVES